MILGPSNVKEITLLCAKWECEMSFHTIAAAVPPLPTLSDQHN
jgi:hypothetical protein